VAGEALFNDGTALVLFELFTDVLQTAAVAVSPSNFLLTFVRMAAGGMGAGAVFGLCGAVALGYTESGTLVSAMR
jgi:NhaP-type Na+/H+ or K+/H+ antiporter